MSPETAIEFEAQDRAEVFDETNLTEDGEAIANFDDIDDVFDVTAAEDDADEDDADEDDDLDPDEIDDEIAGARDDEGSDIERETLSADADDGDEAGNDKTGPAGLEGGRDPADDVDDDADKHVDKQLDKGLKETFPASDPVSINPGAD